MTHSTADNNSIDVVNVDDPYRDLPRPTPEERITQGMDLTEHFGIRAEESDDEDDHPGRTDAIAARESMGIVRVIDPYRDLPRATPEERQTMRGFDLEKILGICADELDDEFLEEVMVPSSVNAAREKRS